MDADDTRFPAGAGWHPWFGRDVRRGHDVRVCVEAGEVYQLEDMIPTGEIRPVRGEEDLRRCPAIGDRRLDTCYRGVTGPLRLRWGEVELTMTSSANVAHAVVYTPAHAVAIEPQTCAIDAFNLAARGVANTGVSVVEPGRPLVAETAWRCTIGAP